MKKIILVLFLLVNSIYAQKRDVIYRIATDFYPTIGYAYVVSVFIFKRR
jgi:hypothetical protein